jgi:four helix bundle protein
MTSLPPQRVFNLEERLLNFSAGIIVIAESIKPTRAGNHLSGQLLRSGTSPYANHGEAEAAESREDFIHKLRLCHKELRETRRWLRLIGRAALHPDCREIAETMIEADELVRIFAASIRTTQKNGSKTRGRDE